MNKQDFFALTAIVLLAALALSAPAARAATTTPSATIPGTVCLTEEITETNDPTLTIPSTSTNTLIFDSIGQGRYRVTSFAQQSLGTPGTIVTAFCEGFAAAAGSQLVGTLTCLVDGSQIPFSGTQFGEYPFWTSSVYHYNLTYKSGKIMLPGYVWSTYEYTIPGLFSTASPSNSQYGPYAYYGNITAIPKCSTVTSAEEE